MLSRHSMNKFANFKIRDPFRPMSRSKAGQYVCIIPQEHNISKYRNAIFGIKDYSKVDRENRR